jgi:hypothetical protein
MNDVSNHEKELSTTALAKELNKSSQELFQKMAELGFINRTGNTWDLTAAGKLKGGIYKEHEKYGRYIVWPQSLKDELDGNHPDDIQHFLTSTHIGKHFEISASRTNSLLSELGLIEKGVKGWLVTDLGKRLGGVQSQDRVSGVPYVRWPESFLNNKMLIASVQEIKGNSPASSQEPAQITPSNEVGFREKFKPSLRATDGHYVRSKAEMLVDNWLYVAGHVHAYERRLPVEEEVYSDFYIPQGKVYIEYWGFDDDAKYLARKAEKLGIYKKYGFHLIELTEKEVQNLDDNLPRSLLAFGVSTE